MEDNENMTLGYEEVPCGGTRVQEAGASVASSGRVDEGGRRTVADTDKATRIRLGRRHVTPGHGFCRFSQSYVVRGTHRGIRLNNKTRTPHSNSYIHK